MDTEARTQMRVEIAPLPKSAIQAPQGHIFVQSIGFGSTDIDNPNPEIVTGVEDIHIRDASGNIVDVIQDVKHRAFVPKKIGRASCRERKFKSFVDRNLKKQRDSNK